MILGDMVLFFAAEVVAYLIRFDFTISPDNARQILSCLPYLIVIKLMVFYFFGAYRGMWRYSSLIDAWVLLKATIVSGMIITSVGFIIHRFQGYSRGVILLDSILTFLFTGGYRLFIRILHNRGYLDKTNRGSKYTEAESNRKKRRVVLVGAGDAGEKTYREIRDNPSLGYQVVAFADDDPGKRGFLIHGIPVIGPVSELPYHIEKLNIQEILITMPSASGPQMRKIVELCEKTSVPCKTLPGLGEIIDGKISVKALRDVNYDDLLGREPVHLDTEAISGYLRGKCVLVTGAGGSIGSELCRQIIKFEPAKLVLLDCSESNLYAIQMELEFKLGFKGYIPILADVQHAKTIDSIIKAHKPDILVHAAAKKHVPLMEENPWEAVFNNVIGTMNVMNAAVENGVEKFVMVSTDKAVRPTNVMGASKRVCELLMHMYDGHSKTTFMSVRFGNVVGSAGSVIPLFREQIAYGGPVTVTHPDVTRYFMTIPEATQLILQAGALGKGGEIFILKMGKPVKIVEMARDLIRLSGKEPNKDIEIVFTGLRPGEKLYEELITVGEGIVETTHEKIMVLRNEEGLWNGHTGQEKFSSWLKEGIYRLKEAALARDGEKIRAALKELVQEYKPENKTDPN